MKRSRPFVRAIAMAFAAAQLAASAAAPVLEAFASAEDNTPYAVGTHLRAPPKHVHDATTCPVCRLLDSPARLESGREPSQIERGVEVQSVYLVTVVQRPTATGFLSRAPPTPLC